MDLMRALPRAPSTPTPTTCRRPTTAGSCAPCAPADRAIGAPRPRLRPRSPRRSTTPAPIRCGCATPGASTFPDFDYDRLERGVRDPGRRALLRAVWRPWRLEEIVAIDPALRRALLDRLAASPCSRRRARPRGLGRRAAARSPSCAAEVAMPPETAARTPAFSVIVPVYRHWDLVPDAARGARRPDPRPRGLRDPARRQRARGRRPRPSPCRAQCADPALRGARAPTPRATPGSAAARGADPRLHRRRLPARAGLARRAGRRGRRGPGRARRRAGAHRRRGRRRRTPARPTT